MSIPLYLHFFALVSAVFWVAFDPGFEPIVVIFGLLASLVRLLNNRKNNELHVEEEDAIPSSISNQSSDIRKASETEVQQVTKRFCQVLNLMNENRSYDKYTIAKLAQLLSLPTISELENVFEGKNEPSFQFMEDFCKIFGVNKDWLAEGKSTPYFSDDATHFNPLDYFEEIRATNPDKIYFVLCKSDVGETLIVLKFTDWKFRILHRTWHISSHVGGGGQRQIYGMYRLINKLRNEGFYTKCSGRILNKDIFRKLVSGKVFPGAVIDHPMIENPWWDDFTDVYQKYPIAENYEIMYGKGFSYAQSVVRWNLKDEEKRRSANPSL